MKARFGRGRTIPVLKKHFTSVLRDQFHRLRCTGIEINWKFLLDAAVSLVHDESVDVTQNEIEENLGRPIHEIINENFIDDFCDRYSIFTRARTGNKTLSSEKTAERNKYIYCLLFGLSQEGVR